MNLRKVCHDFRNFIDDAIPSSSMRGIDVIVNKDAIDLSLEDSRAAFRRVQYPKNSQPELFWKDLEYLLKHQKNALYYFNVNLEFPEIMRKLPKDILEKVHAKFLKRLEQLLESLKSPLPVKKLCLTVGDQNEVMSVLPFIDAKKVEEIFIWPGRGKYWRVFELDRVVQTEQWKNLKKFDTANLMVEEPMESFIHFESCRVYIETVTPEIIKMLKETFYHSPNLQSFDLHFEPDFKSYQLKQILDNISDGRYVDDELCDGCWYSVIPEDSEYAISMRSSCFSWVIFSRVKVSKIQELLANNVQE